MLVRLLALLAVCCSHGHSACARQRRRGACSGRRATAGAAPLQFCRGVRVTLPEARQWLPRAAHAAAGRLSAVLALHSCSLLAPRQPRGYPARSPAGGASRILQRQEGWQWRLLCLRIAHWSSCPQPGRRRLAVFAAAGRVAAALACLWIQVRTSLHIGHPARSPAGGASAVFAAAGRRAAALALLVGSKLVRCCAFVILPADRQAEPLRSLQRQEGGQRRLLCRWVQSVCVAAHWSPCLKPGRLGFFGGPPAGAPARLVRRWRGGANPELQLGLPPWALWCGFHAHCLRQAPRCVLPGRRTSRRVEDTFTGAEIGKSLCVSFSLSLSHIPLSFCLQKHPMEGEQWKIMFLHMP